MQFKVFSIFATATLVAAATNITPPFSGNPPPTITPSQCPSGELHCCQDSQLSTASAVATLLKPHGISQDSISGYVGITCTSIPATGPCSKHPLCCSNDKLADIVLGCNPVNL